MLKTWPSPIFEKNFFPAENAGNMPEIAVSADFHLNFSLHFVVFFSHKYISDITFSFVCSFVLSFVRSLTRSFVRSYFHYQVGPISMWLVLNVNQTSESGIRFSKID